MLARESPIGVIYRRGPSKWTQIIRWNTATDTFDYGTWFHGQMYPERSDISPDGTRLLYFATNYSEKNRSGSYPCEWIGISRIPWLTPHALWPNGDTHYGGGLFETDTRVWINWTEGMNWRRAKFFYPPGLEVSYHLLWDHHWHMLFRLEREGWKPIVEYPSVGDPSLGTVYAVHKKSKPNSPYSLIMTSTYYQRYPWQGADGQTFEVRDEERKTVTPVDGAVWADWDKKGRLVYAKDGKLFATDIEYSGKLTPRELADFNALRPKRTHTPEWARKG